VVALLVSLVLVLTKHTHGHFTMDNPGAVQKFHVDPTPRVGGIGIYLGLGLAWLLLPQGEVKRLLGTILIAGIPALLFGLVEDMTKRVGVLPRLLATMFSGALACTFSGVALSRLDVPLIDGLLAFGPVALLFTAFAVGGVANAINIIDGFHGLASGVLILALMVMAVLAYQVGDASLALVCLLMMAAVAGFWLVNFPWGKLFLGDGGAYFGGFALAWIAVLLPMRNPGVSPWASLLVCAYPFIEVIYSIFRRGLQRQSPGEPDRLHLHSLVATQFIQKMVPRLAHDLQNAAVAPVLWIFAAVPAILAVQYASRTGLLALILLATAVVYHVAYRALVTSMPAPLAGDTSAAVQFK
jgi:UDP-N-acetylmuramyl pentapeptide phosphotransferase/UDP-N-acetylglucosamine-1-phosphate transferase